MVRMLLTDCDARPSHRAQTGRAVVDVVYPYRHM